MYNPRHFTKDDIPVLQEFVRRHGFATLVTAGPGGLFASHLPMLLDPEPAPYGTLRGHLARANPHWREANPETAALAIFSGPQGYISPNWYPSKRESGKVVPTWNYVTVHAHGALRLFDDVDRLRSLVATLTDKYEAALPRPWKIDDAPADFIAAQLKAIVGIEIPIARLDGKWKMSQNRSEADRQGVVRALRAAGDSNSLAIADLVAGEGRARDP
jgi:transcriptional regulator